MRETVQLSQAHRDAHAVTQLRICLSFISLFVVVALLLSRVQGARADQSLAPYDVVIAGATAAGIVAAIAVVREGGRPLVIEPSLHIGGMMTGGLSAADVCQDSTMGGISREIFQRIGAHYSQKMVPRFEPHVAALVFKELIQESKISILSGVALKSVQKKLGTIQSVTLADGRIVQGGVFIDATYEGDLMSLAGVEFRIGRESVREYNEPSAGARPDGGMKRHQFQAVVNPYDDKGKLLDGVHTKIPPVAGSGDHAVPSYNFRPCITKREEIKVPFAAPDGYSRNHYELLLRYLIVNPKVVHGDIFTILKIPKGKYDLNNGGPFSTNLIGGSWDYPEGNAARRQQIFDDHLRHIKGLLYFLSTDPAVPARIRNEVATWGYCKDEFVDSGNFPSQLYVREARRMVGEYVLTEKDIIKQRKKSDSIGIASCPIESHHVQRIVGINGGAFNEGHLQTSVKPYQIPYRSILPKKREAANLLVPVALSASHVAYSSLRMEPVYMTLGHSAGVAAMLAVKIGNKVHDVDRAQLREKLLAQKQRLGAAPIKG